MANNRMYIVCTRCVMQEKEDCRFYIGKYFPSEGWYLRGSSDFTKAYNQFLEDHSHSEAQTLFGYDPNYGFPFYLYFEAKNRSQDKILMKIGELVSKEKDADSGTDREAEEV